MIKSISQHSPSEMSSEGGAKSVFSLSETDECEFGKVLLC